jgi:hypothetical protein
MSSASLENHESVKAKTQKNDSGTPMHRAQTVEFVPISPRRQRLPSLDLHSEQPVGAPPNPGSTHRPSVPLGVHRTHTQPSLKHRGFGGFPMPFDILSSLFRRIFPKLQRKLTRTVTMPISTTITSVRDNIPAGSRPVPYVSFDAVVSRNSVFHQLDNDQLEELGGVEYRALNALLWIVAGVCLQLYCFEVVLTNIVICFQYHIGIQLVSFIVVAPYMSMNKWSSNFHLPQQHKFIPPVWCALPFHPHLSSLKTRIQGFRRSKLCQHTLIVGCP